MSTISTTSNAMLISPNYSDYENPNASLGEDEFLELLITQLQNQDPLEPMDTKEMTSQLTEFSTLEQMEMMNSNLSSMNSFSTLGKDVTYLLKDTSTGLTTEETGTVESIKVSDGTSYLEVNDSFIELGDVIQISEAE